MKRLGCIRVVEELGGRRTECTSSAPLAWRHIETYVQQRASRLALRVSRPANFFSLGCDPSLLYVVKGKGRRARLRSLHNVLVKAMLALQLISACQGILGTLDVHVAEVERLL